MQQDLGCPFEWLILDHVHVVVIAAAERGGDAVVAVVFDVDVVLLRCVGLLLRSYFTVELWSETAKAGTISLLRAKDGTDWRLNILL
jgi:hypothetical protein